MYHTEPITNIRNITPAAEPSCLVKAQWLSPSRVGLNGWLNRYLTGDIDNALCGHGAAFHDTMVHCRCDINAYIWSCCSVQHERITSNQYLKILEIVTLSQHKIEFLDSHVYLLL